MSANTVGQKIQMFLSPFAPFTQDQVISSSLLLLCTIVALVWANSPFHHYYETLFQLPLGFHFNDFSFSLSLEAWISEGLMALFFFFLGLEVKREFLVGELRNWQQSLPVIMGAMGGMLFPAAFYLFATMGSPQSMAGWGIPMATDTAFALGLIAFLHKRIPNSVAVFVTALAIIDDIGAMLIIAVIYTDSIKIMPLLITAGLALFLYVISLLGVRKPWFYFVVGVLIWLALHEAHVHSTVAGILVALTIPAQPAISRQGFIAEAGHLINRFESKVSRKEQTVLSDSHQQDIVSAVEKKAKDASAPIRLLENTMERPIMMIVMPLFALANAGLVFSNEFFMQSINSPSALGVFYGLVFGKCIGIVLMTKLALVLGWGKLAKDLGMKHVVGIGLLAGIGFTMSLLIATLAFSDPAELNKAKSAILFSSLMSGIFAYLWFRFALPGKE